MKNSNKSIWNPYNTDVGSVINSAIQKSLQRVQTCIPAIIKEVKDRNHVVVSPAVQQINSDWQSVPWANITLPVYTPAGAGTFLSFSLDAGDTGWIIAGDLDPSLFFQDSSRPARQNVFDRHKYQYGFFLPCNMETINVSSEDNGGFIIKSGDTKIVVKHNEIDIVSNNKLKINAKSVNITSSGNNIEIDGVNFKNHTHSVGSLEVPVTSAEGSPSTITGNTGGVN